VITVWLNDNLFSLSGQTVAELLGALDLPARGIAVAVNGEVVRRADWPGARLSEGDRVEVLTAAQGG
jgi:sulfur carrier protein